MTRSTGKWGARFYVLNIQNDYILGDDMFHLILFIVYLTTLPIALASNDETISAELTKRMRKEIIISQFDVLYRYVPGTIHENH